MKKVILIGLGVVAVAIVGALVYVASQILLYPIEKSFLSLQAIRVFQITFLFSSLLIFQSWRRGSGRGQVTVSQSAIYSTITFFSVGSYFVVSGFISRWASRWKYIGIPAGPIIFLSSLVVLSTVLLAATFRHRVRAWIRRHLFAGRYDYRQFWMDTTEQVQSIESPEVAAAAMLRSFPILSTGLFADAVAPALAPSPMIKLLLIVNVPASKICGLAPLGLSSRL